ncbi:MAG: spore germination protein [Paenibacillaceae bacterium]|uniref:Spore germination protein n=1 Tax=Paenibacillus mellifer TaxID=2937794 RepID=A0A9X2BRD5_9BACL|nr:GerAB/ArcD/ProY family transporter [Paenibacillus mellifer]MBW4841660.1 spore germination protein [Paenibacillaceae bacterium]MCK8487220.1 spore germination protein [Paenibacillus mellifer]
MVKISAYQLFAITSMFQLGTTLIFAFGASAGRDAWIAALLSSGLGSVLIGMYTLLQKMHPGQTLVEWFTCEFGRWLGTPLAWLYPLVWIYDAGRGVADLKFLLPSTILPGTPAWILVGSFLLLILYFLFSGIEVICRLGGMIFPVLAALFSIEILLLLSSGMHHFSYLQPVLGEGWGRVWKAVWPLGITQSFGESIELAMIWTLLASPKRLMGINLAATLNAGIVITLFDVLAIIVLGEKIFVREYFPLIQTLKQVSLAEFIENLDVMFVIYLFLSTFFKISLHMYMSVIAVKQLIRIRNPKWLMVLFAAVTFFVGMTMAKNMPEHTTVAFKTLPNFIWLPLFIVLPVLLFLVSLVRRLLAKRRYA